MRSDLFESDTGPVDPRLWREVEAQLGWRLPPDIASYYAIQNGGRGTFSIAFGKEDTVIRGLREVTMDPDRFPAFGPHEDYSKYLAFADDAFGNTFLMDRKSVVYFLDHETSRKTKVSRSFSDWLAMLTPMKTIEAEEVSPLKAILLADDVQELRKHPELYDREYVLEIGGTPAKFAACKGAGRCFDFLYNELRQRGVSIQHALYGAHADIIRQVVRDRPSELKEIRQAIFLAIERSTPEVLDFLIQSGARIDERVTDDDWRSLEEVIPTLDEKWKVVLRKHGVRA